MSQTRSMNDYENRNPAVPDTLARAEELYLDGDVNAALDMLRNLYGQSLPSSVRGQALALEVVCLEELGRKQEADNVIVDVMKEEGDDLAFVLAAGIHFADLESYIHAETFLRNMCELDPEDYQVWYNLAITLGREGRYPEAVQAYDESIRRKPDFASNFLQKGYCLYVMGQRREAAELYRSYLEMEPDDSEAWMTLAGLDSQLGEHDAADEAFERAVALEEDPTQVYFEWAMAAAQRGDLERINECIDRLSDIEEEGWPALIATARREEIQENTWRAWELLGEAFDAVRDEEEPDDADVDYVSGTLLRFAARHDMAMHAAEHLDRLYDEGKFSEDVLEAMQHLTGRYANAMKSYQVVLQALFNLGDDSHEEIPQYRVYGVAAEDAGEAERLAQGFEARCTGAEWQTFGIHQISPPDEGRVGVYWRSELLDTPPTREP